MAFTSSKIFAYHGATGATGADGANGDTSISGTPVDNQVAIWTDASTIEGTNSLVFDSTGLDISGNQLVLGSDNGAATRTDGTAKAASIEGYHDTNAEEPLQGMYLFSSDTVGEVKIGGGSSIANTATDIEFYTAVNNTTTSGTKRMSINKDGDCQWNNTSGTAKMTWDASTESLGIGAAVPGYPLEVVGNVYASTGYLTANNQQIGWRNAGDSANHDWILNSSDVLQYRSGGSPLLSIKDDGNVGIGTDVPATPLNATIAHSSGAITPVIKVSTTGGYDDNAGAGIDFGIDQDSYSTWVAGRISAPRTGTNYGGSLDFYTNDNSGPAAIVRRMTIDDSGNVGLGGVTAPAPETGTDTALHINGVIRSECSSSYNTLTRETGTYNTPGMPLSLANNTTGTPAAGFGTRFGFYGSTNNSGSPVHDQTQMLMEAIWTDPTHGAATSDLKFELLDSGTRGEKFRITGAGAIGLDDSGTPDYGTSGQVLTSGGSGAAATWEDAGSGSSPWTTSGDDIYYDDGNVGIGVSDLSGLNSYDVLNLYNDGGACYLNIDAGSSSGDSGIMLKNQGTDKWRFYNEPTTGHLEISPAWGTDVVSIKPTGEVGIGTDSPNTELEVEGGGDIVTINSTSSYAGLSFEETTEGSTASRFSLRTMDGTNGLKFYDSGASAERMRIDWTGDCHWFNTSGVSKLHWDASADSLGIGGAPSRTLHVKHEDTGTLAGIAVENTSSGDASIWFREPNSEWVIGLDNDDDNKFKIAASSSLGSDDRLTITTDGNVGIGDDDPSYELEVKATANSAEIGINGTAGNNAVVVLKEADDIKGFVGIEGSSDNLKLVTGTSFGTSVQGINIDSSGNVGIGTAGPHFPVHIYGASTDLAGLVLRNTNITVGDKLKIGFDAAWQSDVEYGSYVGVEAMSLSGGSRKEDMIFGVRNQSEDGTNPIERLRINSDGAFGLSGANYGTSGQVLTSAGSSAAPTWEDPCRMAVTTITNTDTVTISDTQGDLSDQMIIVNNPNLTTDFTWNIPAPSSVPAGRKIIFVCLDVQASTNGGNLTITAASGKIASQSVTLDQNGNGYSHTDSITWAYSNGSSGEGVIGPTLVSDGSDYWIETTGFDDTDYWERV